MPWCWRRAGATAPCSGTPMPRCRTAGAGRQLRYPRRRQLHLLSVMRPRRRGIRQAQAGRHGLPERGPDRRGPRLGHPRSPPTRRRRAAARTGAWTSRSCRTGNRQAASRSWTCWDDGRALAAEVALPACGRCRPRARKVVPELDHSSVRSCQIMSPSVGPALAPNSCTSTKSVM